MRRSVAPVKAFPRPAGEDLPERLDEQDQVVTGEAVILKINPAGPVQLIAAGIIDALASITGMLVILALLSLVGSMGSAGGQTYTILSLVVAVVVIPALVETATTGRSLGKWILGVQIVRDDGGAIRFRHAILRSLVALIEIYLTLGSVALIATLANSRHKRLGDLLAGTYPVSVNPGAVLPPPLLMPPELAEWAVRADVSRLPAPLAWRVRQFLNTTTQLAPEHRYRLALALAQEVSPHVGPPPPAHSHPERFLAAVLVIRRDREYADRHRAMGFLTGRAAHTLPYGLNQ